MISIVVATWNAYDFLQILIESLEHYSHFDYEVIIVDNSVHKQSVKGKNIKYYPMETNIGHGEALNFGVKQIHESYPFVMFLDVDTHVLTHRWEFPFIAKMKEFDVIGGKGVPEKPIRPACMFMKRELAGYDWSPTPDYKGVRGGIPGYDVAIKAYHKLIEDKIRVGFLDSMPNIYPTLTGEVWGIEGIPLCYHHWHGSHLKERQVDFPNQDLILEKKKLFSNIPWRLP